MRATNYSIPWERVRVVWFIVGHCVQAGRGAIKRVSVQACRCRDPIEAKTVIQMKDEDVAGEVDVCAVLGAESNQARAVDD